MEAIVFYKDYSIPIESWAWARVVWEARSGYGEHEEQELLYVFGEIPKHYYTSQVLLHYPDGRDIHIGKVYWKGEVREEQARDIRRLYWAWLYEGRNPRELLLYLPALAPHREAIQRSFDLWS